jgi:hypothetical protein
MTWTDTDVGSRTALTTTRGARGAGGRFWEDVRLQKLWLALQRRPWRTLAVLPGSEPEETMEIAEVLGQIAWCYRGEPTNVLDLRDVSLRLAEYQAQDAQAQADSGVRVLFGLRSITENPASAIIARASDAAVLCVQLGKTDRRAAMQTIEDVGREKLLGTVLVRPGRR